MAGLRRYLERLGDKPPTPPRAVLVVSAHGEEAEPTVTTSARPPMLYDCRGFPAAAYELEWPAPGAADVAAEVQERLAMAGFRSPADEDAASIPYEGDVLGAVTLAAQFG